MASYKRRRGTDVMLAGVGLALTLLAIACIKNYILRTEDRLPTAGGVFALEVAAFVTLLGAFVFGELIHGYEKAIKGKRNVSTGLSCRDVLVVLSALAGSLAVYLGFIHLAGG